HNTMNDVRGEDPASGEPRVMFSWLGQHSQSDFDDIGGPYPSGDGHLTASQYVGVLTLHADKSPSDHSDDLSQPFTTTYIQSDLKITSGNSQFNDTQMASEYAAMTEGHPALTHAEDVGCPTPVECPKDATGNTYVRAGDPGNPGGYTHGQGFGPYTMEPGDSIHIVLAEGVAGISRQMAYVVGADWLRWYRGESVTLTLPDGSTTSNGDEYKNAWVYTGQDSLFQTFERASENYESGMTIEQPPPPPDLFEVNSGGDRITLTWSDNAEFDPVNPAVGYTIYRAIHVPDTTYTPIYECGEGTGNPIVHEFEDKTAIRGFDYYYYIVSFDDGNSNPEAPGVPLVSSKFYTMTSEPASLKRPAGNRLADIRIVPNPFNIKARELQFGESDPDRIMFYNIPPFCNIRIFTERGDLIKTIRHTDGSGDEAWNSVTSSRQVVVSGLYIAHFEVTQDYRDPLTGELVYRKGDAAIRKFIIIR
ncbi:MAG: fibronectin, partial [Fidelibacterota bacterium]